MIKLKFDPEVQARAEELQNSFHEIATQAETLNKFNYTDMRFAYLLILIANLEREIQDLKKVAK